MGMVRESILLLNDTAKSLVLIVYFLDVPALFYSLHISPLYGTRQDFTGRTVPQKYVKWCSFCLLQYGVAY